MRGKTSRRILAGKKGLFEMAEVKRMEGDLTMDYAELIQRARELTSKDDGLFLSGVFVPVEVPLLGALSDALQDARNELCLRCGKYRDAHNVACDGCRWKDAE